MNTNQQIKELGSFYCTFFELSNSNPFGRGREIFGKKVFQDVFASRTSMRQLNYFWQHP